MKADVDASQLLAYYESKILGIQRSVFGTALAVGRRLAEDLRARTLRPRRLNIQDAEPGTPVGGQPVRMDTKPDQVIVVLRPHWTVARTSALFEVARRTGNAGLLQRDGLWVRGVGRRRSDSKGYTSRDGLTFKSFAQNPQLSAWANRRDRGTQALRSAVFLGRPEIWKLLTIQPAIDRAMPLLRGAVRRAVETA